MKTGHQAQPVAPGRPTAPGRGPWVAIRNGFAALVVFLGVLFGLQTPALAHAVLVSSTPEKGSIVQEAPAEVVLTFSESISPVKDRIRVLGPDGRRADTAAPVVQGATLRIPLQGNLARGTYLVSFRVISADGHPVPGGLTFSYGEPSATPVEVIDNPDDSLASKLIKVNKWLGYMGLMLLVGAAWVLTVLWPERLDRRGPRRLLWTGWGIVGLTSLIGLYLQAPYTGGTGLIDVKGSDISAVMSSTYGVAVMVRLAVLAIAAIMLRPLIRGGSTTVDRVLVLILAGIGALTYSIAGHPAASPVPPVSVVADSLHLGAVAFWLGGLVMLAAYLLPRSDEREAEAIGPMWSRWAGLAIAIVLLAGVVSALIEVSTPTALVGTPYGRWVLVKIGLVVLILGAALLARRLIPRLETGKLRRLVMVELAIAVLVLGVTAILTQTTPARTAEAIATAPQPGPTYTTTLNSSLYRLDVEVDPGKVGNNLVHLWAYRPDGTPLKVVEWKAEASLPSAGVEPIEIPTLKLTDNHVTGSISLPTAGEWRFRFTLRISEIDQDSVVATVPVK